MTLLELLRQELPKRGGWPVNITSIVQDGDGHLCFKSSPGIPRYNKSRKEWEIPGHHQEDWNGGESCCQISDDHATAIVTREQYSWDGTGLPPVGVEIEVQSPRYGWKKAVVTSVTDNWLIAKYDDGAEFAGCHRFLENKTFVDVHDTFRPIRTKRDEALEEMRKVVTNYNKTDVTQAIEQLYDAGYRKLSD